MRIVLAVILASTLLATAASASETEEPVQRLIEMKVLDGDRRLLECMLAVVVGNTAAMSSIPAPESDAGGFYMLVASDYASATAAPEGEDWESLPDRAKRTPAVLSCGGLYFAIYSAEGTGVELAVREQGPVYVAAGDEGSEPIIHHPALLGSLVAPL